MVTCDDVEEIGRLLLAIERFETPENAGLSIDVEGKRRLIGENLVGQPAVVALVPIGRFDFGQGHVRCVVLVDGQMEERVEELGLVVVLVEDLNGQRSVAS